MASPAEELLQGPQNCRGGMPRKAPSCHSRKRAVHAPGTHLDVSEALPRRRDLPIGCLSESAPSRSRRHPTSQRYQRHDRRWKRYEKPGPGHRAQVDVKFIDYVLEKFPFNVEVIQTDNGSDFQAGFRWHVLDRGIQHVCIKPRAPRLNGKVERCGGFTRGTRDEAPVRGDFGSRGWSKGRN